MKANKKAIIIITLLLGSIIAFFINKRKGN